MGMNPGEWYKEFGSGKTEKFYHILSVEKEVDVIVYDFDPVRKRVLSEASSHYDPKWWMEHELKNDFHMIPRSAVPFIMSM